MKLKTIPLAALAAITLAIPALLTLTAHAGTYTWGGGTSGWGDTSASGWSGGPPFAGDTATINSGQVNFTNHDTFGDASTTTSASINLNGGTLASAGYFTTIWNLNLNGGTLLANGGANGDFPSFQLAGTVTVGGSQVSTIDATTEVNANNQINIGGHGNSTLVFDVANVTADASSDLIINARLQNNSLTKSGVGTLTLTNAGSSYTGNISVTDGTLQVNGGIIDATNPTTSALGNPQTASRTITIGSGAFLTFAGNDSLGNSRSTPVVKMIVNGGTINNNGAFFTTLGAVDLNGGTINSVGGAAGAYPSFQLGGMITVGGSATSTISGSGTNSQMTLGIANGNNTSTTFDVADATSNSASDLNVSVVLQNGAGATNGLIKSGVGTMTLSGVNTYTGKTSVENGTLILDQAFLNDSADVEMTTGATLQLDFAATDTIDELLIDGLPQASGTWGRSGHPTAQHTTSLITGDGLLQVTTGPAGGFTGWASNNGATGQTPDQDHDNDGVANGIEYFMGQTGSSFTAMPGLNGTNTVTWTMDRAYNGTYEVQTSPDLSVWTNVAPKPVPSGGNLSYTLPTGLGKQFVRLLVTPEP